MAPSLDDYLASRFGPVFDALNDAGGVPEELMECLRWGGVCCLAKQGGVEWPRKTHVVIAFTYSSDFIAVAPPGGPGSSVKYVEPVTPEALFSHLSHLTEAEALT